MHLPVIGLCKSQTGLYPSALLEYNGTGERGIEGSGGGKEEQVWEGKEWEGKEWEGKEWEEKEWEEKEWEGSCYGHLI